MLKRVDLGQFRAQLSRLVSSVEQREQRVILWRHGAPVAALVSLEDFDRLWSWEDEEIFGPKDEETGRPMGMSWVKRTGWTPERPELRERPEAAGGVGAASAEDDDERRKWWEFW